MLWWIDGQRKSYDEVSFLQRYSPRRPGSAWSKINVAKVDALIAAERMQPGGLAEVAAAKADGRWETAYESQRTATIPPDLAAALAANADANAAFGRLGKSEQYAMILPLLKARTPATRAKLSLEWSPGSRQPTTRPVAAAVVLLDHGVNVTTARLDRPMYSRAAPTSRPTRSR